MPRISPRRGLAALLSVLALGLALAPAAGAAPAVAPSRASLQAALDRIVGAAAGPPGISVLIGRPGGAEYLGAGLADVASGRPPRRDEAFRIASVAKGFNSMLAVLAAKTPTGPKLDSTLSAWIPGVLPAAEGVTMAQLLQHTSGLADYIRDPDFVEGFIAHPRAYLAPRTLTGFVSAKPLEFAPGSRYHYSDTDNVAAGLMLEAAAGVPYERLLGQRIFGPLGMKNSSLPRTPRLPRPFMHGYDVAAGKRPADVSEAINPAGAWASGGIVSTAADLNRFARAYVPTVLGAARTLPRPFLAGTSSPPGPGTNSAGIGIFRYATSCGTVYGHTGSFPGYRTLVAASADGRRTVVFLVNAQIVPGQGSKRISDAIRQAQRLAVCRALR